MDTLDNRGLSSPLKRFRSPAHYSMRKRDMRNDCADRKNRPCPDSKPPRPINLHADPPPDDSGFLIVRFKAGALPPRHRELASAAKEAGLLALVKMFEAFDLTARPLVTSIKAEELER